MFEIYTDKPTKFECKIELEGASLNEAAARLILESNDKSMLYEGTINQAGQCEINVGKVKGIFSDNDVGSLKLEVIVDDAYFLPWENNFKVSTSRKVRVVEVSEQKSSPKMKVEIKNQPSKSYNNKINKAVTLLERKNINASNIIKNKKTVYSVISELFSDDHNPETVIHDIVYMISK